MKKQAKVEERPKAYKKIYNERHVAKVVHKKAITLYAEKKGGPAGSKKFLAVYNKAVNHIITKLSAAERLHLQRTAEKWTESGPPEEVKIA